MNKEKQIIELKNENEKLKNEIIFLKKTVNNLINENNNISEININNPPELLKTNWNQINTIIDNGQQIEINFTLKAINLQKGKSLKTFTYFFEENSSIKIILFNVNNKSYKYSFSNNKLTIDFDLYNNETLDVNMLYNETYFGLCNYYRNEFIRIPFYVKNQQASIKIKFPLKYHLIGFEDNNMFKLYDKKIDDLDKNFNIYYWNGIVPEKGLSNFIKLSYKNAKWKIEFNEKINCKNKIKNTTIIYPKFFFGGNNQNVEYEISTNLSDKIDNKNIIEKNNKFYFIFKNTNLNQVYINLKITFTNNINNFWYYHLNEKTIPKFFDDKYYFYFNQFALNIIKKDKSNDPNYIKIGKWIHNNINYNENYSKKNLNPLEILAFREGICDHFVLLYITLLNSIDIKCIRIGGYACSENKKIKNLNINENGHSWVLANINNNWIPLDATWGIYGNKFPVSHIFEFFINGSTISESSDDIERCGINKKMEFIEDE